MKLSELIKNVEIRKIEGSGDIDIEGITVDSNKVDRGYMFIAVKGTKTDGHKFIGSALENGAHAIMVEDNPGIADSSVSVVETNDTRSSLPFVASNFYKNPTLGIKLVGITGTNGKTTISYIFEQIWKEEGHKCGIIGTVANRFGGKSVESSLTTPDSVELNSMLAEMRDSGTTHAAIEVSSHALDLKRVDSCNFDVAIFSNLTQDHLDYHKDFNSYFEAKKRLFTDVLDRSVKKNKTSVINIDDEYGKKLLQEIKGKKVTYSIEDSSADLFAGSNVIKNDGISADVKSVFGNFKIESKLIGKHNLYNLLAAAGGALSLGSRKELVEKAIKKVNYIPGRLEKITNNAGINLFVDYAHTPDALKNVIFSIRSVYKGNLTTVVGCGGDRDRKKRPLMGEIAQKYSDNLVITSDNPRTEDPEAIIEDIKKGLKPDSGSNVIDITDREKAIAYAINNAKKGDTVLIAGKGHEDYQIIGKKKIFFDDREISRKYLDEKNLK